MDELHQMVNIMSTPNGELNAAQGKTLVRADRGMGRRRGLNSRARHRDAGAGLAETASQDASRQRKTRRSGLVEVPFGLCSRVFPLNSGEGTGGSPG